MRNEFTFFVTCMFTMVRAMFLFTFRLKHRIKNNKKNITLDISKSCRLWGNNELAD